MYSAPTPFGPCSLCPLRLSRFISLFFILTGIFPTACTASVCSTVPASFTISLIFFIGKITPVSLFAYIIVTIAVLSFISVLSCSRSICPFASTLSSVSVYP